MDSVDLPQGEVWLEIPGKDLKRFYDKDISEEYKELKIELDNLRMQNENNINA